VGHKPQNVIAHAVVHAVEFPAWVGDLAFLLDLASSLERVDDVHPNYFKHLSTTVR